MMVQSTALFDAKTEANRVIDALEDAGFETVEIDADWTRVGPGDELDAEDLVRLGVASHQAARFADAIRDGATLVVVSCDETRLMTLRDTMTRFDRRAPSDIPPSGHLRFTPVDPDELRDNEPIDETGVHRNRAVQEGWRKADSEQMIGEHDTGSASGLSRRAHADQSESLRTNPEAAASTQGMLDRFETSFHHHYDRHFADTELPYGHYARAYHYGVVLAEHAGFRGRNWDDIEEFARQGWNSQIHGDFRDVREAVRYGWRAVRGRGDRSRPR